MKDETPFTHKLASNKATMLEISGQPHYEFGHRYTHVIKMKQCFRHLELGVNQRRCLM